MEDINMVTKKVLFVLFMLLLVVPLAACSGDGNVEIPEAVRTVGESEAIGAFDVTFVQVDPDQVPPADYLYSEEEAEARNATEELVAEYSDCEVGEVCAAALEALGIEVEEPAAEGEEAEEAEAPAAEGEEAEEAEAPAAEGEETEETEDTAVEETEGVAAMDQQEALGGEGRKMVICLKGGQGEKSAAQLKADAEADGHEVVEGDEACEIDIQDLFVQLFGAWAKDITELFWLAGEDTLVPAEGPDEVNGYEFSYAGWLQDPVQNGTMVFCAPDGIGVETLAALRVDASSHEHEVVPTCAYSVSEADVTHFGANSENPQAWLFHLGGRDLPIAIDGEYPWAGWVEMDDRPLDLTYPESIGVDITNG